MTDPPYFLGMTHNGQRGKWHDLEICRPFYEKLAKEFNRILKDDGEFFIFSDWRGYAFYYPIFADYLPVKNCLIWDKGSGCGNCYAFSYEMILYGSKCVKNKKGLNIWREKGFNGGAKKTDGEKRHPTQKPLALIRRMIEEGSSPGDVVLDCFLGSGTTAVAAIETGRHYIGFEISGKYFDIANERIKAAKEAADG